MQLSECLGYILKCDYPNESRSELDLLCSTVIRFKVLYLGVCGWIPTSVNIQSKAIDLSFLVVLFTMLYKVVPTFESIAAES